MKSTLFGHKILAQKIASYQKLVSRSFSGFIFGLPDLLLVGYRCTAASQKETPNERASDSAASPTSSERQVVMYPLLWPHQRQNGPKIESILEGSL
jgi:hypothetical protein